MRSLQFPSADARRALASLRQPKAGRGAADLPLLRKEAVARAIAEVPRILAETGIGSREI